MENSLAEATATVLRPFLADEVLALASAGFRDAVRAYVSGSPGANLRISAPADLLAAIRGQGGPALAGVDLIEADGCEAEALGGATAFGTQIALWLDRITDKPQ